MPMPSLVEYISTLKSYNPGITDKSITIYLLKDGWKVEEIDKAFAEINGFARVSSSVAQPPVNNPASAPALALPPTTVPVATTKTVEVQPQELNSKAIPYPTFKQVKEQVKTAGVITQAQSIPAPIYGPVSAPPPIGTSIPSPTTTPTVTMASMPLATSTIISFSTPTPPVNKNSRTTFSYKDIMGSGAADSSVASATTTSTPKTNQTIASMAGIPENTANIPPPSTTPYVGASFGAPTTAYNSSQGQIISTTASMTMAQAEAVARINASRSGNSTSLPSPAPVSQPVTSSIVTTGVPIQAQPNPATAVRSESSGRVAKTMLWGLVMILCLGGLGFGFMNYVYGVYLFIQEPLTKEGFVAGFAKSLIAVDTAEYETSLSFKVADKEAGTEELNLSKYSESTEDIFSFLPIDAKFSASINGIYNKLGDSPDGKIGFKGSYTGDGVSLNLDIESVKKGEDFYARINTFPAFFIDLSKVKDKWIKISKEDIEDSFGSSFSSILGLSTKIEESKISGSSNEDLTPADFKKQYMEVLSYANEKRVIEVIGEPQKKVRDDKTVIYEYEVKPNLANLISFAEGLDSHMKEKFGEKSFLKDSEDSKKSIDEMKGQEFTYYFNYFRNNTKTLIAVDTKGRPVYIDILSKTAPKSELSKKQLEVGIKLGFSRINQKIEVDAPADSIPYIDAYGLMYSLKKDDVQYQKQHELIKKITVGLENYKAFTGSYPLLLEDLRTSTEQIVSAPGYVSQPRTRSQYVPEASSYPIYGGSFKDMFTNNNMPYKRISTSSYELGYEIHLPNSVKTNSKYVQSPYTYVTTPNDMKGDLIRTLRYVDGLNTRTEKIDSKEAASKPLLDSDSDYVSDSLEQFLGTDPKIKNQRDDFLWSGY